MLVTWFNISDMVQRLFLNTTPTVFTFDLMYHMCDMTLHRIYKRTMKIRN